MVKRRWRKGDGEEKMEKRRGEREKGRRRETERPKERRRESRKR